MVVKQLGHVPVLDALRGVAILLVLGAHAHPTLAPVTSLIPGGYLGVDLFFVLSGFLITSLLVGEYATTGTISLRAFYRRRALRLFPALFLMLGACVAIVAVLVMTGEMNRLDEWLVSALYGAAYITNIATVVSDIPAPELGHLWSLAAEEQFYLIWPPLLALALSRSVRPRMLVLAVSAFVVATLVYRQGLILTGASWDWVSLGPETRGAPPILLGCLAGLLFSYRLVVLPSWIALIYLAPMALAVATPHMFDDGLHVPIFCLGSALLVFVCASEPGWFVARLINRRALRYLGRISYGLYLWHLPIFHTFGWEVGLPLSIAVAATSYRFIEQPFLRRKRRPPATQAPRTMASTNPTAATAQSASTA